MELEVWEGHRLVLCLLFFHFVLCTDLLLGLELGNVTLQDVPQRMLENHFPSSAPSPPWLPIAFGAKIQSSLWPGRVYAFGLCLPPSPPLLPLFPFLTLFQLQEPPWGS